MTTETVPEMLVVARQVSTVIRKVMIFNWTFKSRICRGKSDFWVQDKQKGQILG